jgi:sugar phosphate isomerase/epimerase
MATLYDMFERVPNASGAVVRASVDRDSDRLCLLSSAVPDESAQVIAERARDAGFSAIEWGVGPDQATSAKRAEARGLRELGAFHGLAIAGVTVQSGPAGLDKPASIKPIVSFAAELGAPYVRLWAPVYRGGSFADEVRKRRSALAQAVEIAAGQGVVLLLENRPDSLAPSTTLTRELIDAHGPDEVGVLWDPANGIIEGHLDPRLAIADLGPYLHHVHVKNIAWRRTGGAWHWSYASLAAGMLDWPAVLAALDDSGYRGRLSLDHLPGASTPATLRRELKALASMLAARERARS